MNLIKDSVPKTDGRYYRLSGMIAPKRKKNYEFFQKEFNHRKAFFRCGIDGQNA